MSSHSGHGLAIPLFGRVPGSGGTIRAARDIHDRYAHLSLKGEEELWVVGMDHDNRVVSSVLVASGGEAPARTSPRTALTPLVRMAAPRAVFVHNHLDGDPRPRDGDITFTRRLVDAGRILDVEVVDHVVVGRSSFVSMREHGYMAF